MTDDPMHRPKSHHICDKHAAMGCAPMCDRAGPSNFHRKLVYPRLGVAWRPRRA